MAEEFEAAGIYGGNWWINNMNTCCLSSSSLCSIAANNDYGGSNLSCTNWQTHHDLMDLKSPLLVSHHDERKQNHQNESSPSSASENNGNMLIDSSLGFPLPPSSTSSLLGRPESNFQCVIEEEGGGVDSCNNSEMKRSMNQEFGIDHEQNLSYGMYEDDDEHNIVLHFQQPEDLSLFTNPSVAYCSYDSTNQVTPPSWSKASAGHFLKPYSIPKQHQLGEGFHFLKPYSADHVFASSSPQSQTFHHKASCSPLSSKLKREEAPVSSEEQPAELFKRPRIETPSPLPTFKVRKEKLGDRITALQQLVSPFGKTDTASVLHEAIEYIKYLHDQVSVLSAPYLNNNSPAVHQNCQGCDEKEWKDLRSQGLCLAPISSTFSLANYEIMASELWTHHAYEGPHLLM
ncbi:hypothetical protein QN277_020114 [Acacia crassicarpa]|uniref:BHLH domain-containing protein n=1 Tax=Acacia crassicarpa TaxID=499986 RepID=A0AAE1KCM2_9FABA|nr:hypothetical protein QN277_020114 [Acacia crassicarpa]